ncbi:ferredoxin [Streptomyces sp. NWU339]|uniref:ferredoxin n=1 Tax=Streptomyces sp. NWU339 TaxID=2185284 RepID=UPI000D676F43|nr:ferredoxin [Streptomyces sp. NWU339]PWI06634.1 ferredoxin [Streptomyces sp. NWU339]
MRVIVKDICEGCGLCEANVPEVFRMEGDGTVLVMVDTVPERLEQDVRDAVDDCPTESIEVVD